MTTSKIRLDFKVLLYQEDGWWIAHCLEMDLPAEGKTPTVAIRNLLEIADVQISAALADGNLDSIFSSAPAELWRLYAIGDDKPLTQKPRKPVSSVQVRQFAVA